MDLLVFNKFIRIGQPVDLSVIPLHNRIVTEEGFSTGSMEANFQKRAFTSGQMSQYVQDAGFYQPRWISVETDELGLRNPKGQSQEIEDVILMGDSFTFGWGTNQTEIWSYVLSPEVKKHVYNIGVSGSSPSKQVELLIHLDEEGQVRLSNGSVLFLLVFEGNDFTDPNAYDKEKPKGPGYYFGELPRSFFSESIGAKFKLAAKNAINKILGRKLPLKNAPYMVCTSRVYGKVGFSRSYTGLVKRNNLTRDYSRQLFKQSMIRRALQRLGEHSLQYESRVVILYCPIKSRIYGRYFPEHPALPDKDYLKELMRRSASQFNFGFVDLSEEFARHAQAGKLLYWRMIHT
tara:strand:+ start:359 stop:1399 length:1041 start_codon:yes stop_codon:yes gene_type:complete